MALLKTPAIALNSRKWGEADRIVTFYTLRFGKVRGVARGARRIKSRFGSALEPFVVSDLNLFQKHHDPLYRITQADIRETFPLLREDLTLMSAAARLANLVAAVTGEGDAGPKLFDMLLSGLRALQGSADAGLVVLLYQIRLLGEAGFAPQTDHCSGCGGPVAKAGLARIWFSPQSGGVLCEPCGQRSAGRCRALSPSARALLQHALRWVPAALTRLKAPPSVQLELEAAIEAYVTIVTGRQLPPADFLVAEPAGAPYRSVVPP
ncbi:DNA repair protein RecO [Candidatus Nitrospira bockiana]